MTAALRERKALRVEDLVPDDDELGLALVISPSYRRTFIEVHYLAQDNLPVDPLTFRVLYDHVRAWRPEKGIGRKGPRR